MFIYIFESVLFIGQRKTVITSFPVKRWILESFVNLDNNYPEANKWILKDIQLVESSLSNER